MNILLTIKIVTVQKSYIEMILSRQVCGPKSDKPYQMYVLTIMAFLGVTISFVVRSYTDIAIVKITDYTHTYDEKIINCINYTLPNDTCSDSDLHVEELNNGNCWMIFYGGYMITHLPGAYLSRKYGAKYVFVFVILGSSLMSFLFPLATCSANYILVSVFTVGLIQGPTFPALGDLLAQWLPPFDRTCLGSTVFAGVQIGFFVSNAIMNFSLAMVKESNIFYLIGLIGVVWVIAWIILCYSNPSSHPLISSAELNYLKANIAETDKEMPTPWRAMLRSKPLWALTIAEMGHDFGHHFIISVLYRYYCTITTYSIFHVGILVGIPYLMTWMFTTVVLGYVSDKLIEYKWITRTSLRCNLAVIGAVVPGLGLVCSSYIQCQENGFIVIVVCLAFAGFYYSSLRVNPLDLSPNHAATIMAIVNGAGAMSAIISPKFLDIVTDGTDEEWHSIFWVIFTVNVLTIIPFMRHGSGEVQPWNEPKIGINSSDTARWDCRIEGEPRMDLSNFIQCGTRVDNQIDVETTRF